MPHYGCPASSGHRPPRIRGTRNTMSPAGPQEPPLDGPARPHETDPPKEISTDRLITLSDGVVAIALTLLILAINVPDAVPKGVNSDSVSWLASWLYHNTANSWISYLISLHRLGD